MGAHKAKAGESHGSAGAGPLASGPVETKDSSAFGFSQLRAVFTYMLDAVLITSTSGDIVDANPAACTLSGYAREELIGLPILSLTAPDQPESYKEGWADFLENGRFDSEWRFIRRDGAVLDLETRAVANVVPGYNVAVLRDVTGRKEEEPRLQAERELLQTVLDHIPVMVNLFDPGGALKWVNREWERVLGWTLEEAQKSDIYRDTTPDSKERDRVQRFVAGANGQWEEFDTHVKNGGTLRTCWSNVRLSDGTVIGIGRDITEQKRAESALRESEERFRQLAENTRDVFWMSDPETNRQFYVSPAYEEVWGRSREEFHANPMAFFDSVHPEDQAAFLVAIESKPLGGTFSQEYRIVRPDGEVRWIWDRAFPVFDEQGKIYRTVGIAQDITERKAAEAALQSSESRFRALTENSWDGICLWSPEGQHIYSSPSSLRLLGYGPTDSPNLCLVELIHPDDWSMVQSRFQEALAHPRRGVVVETRVKHTSGTWRWMDCAFTNLIDEPSLGAVVNNYRDVTDRRLAMDELRASQERLSTALWRGNVGLWDLDVATGIFTFSPQYFAQLGYGENEFDSSFDHIVSLVHPDDKQPTLEKFRDQIAGQAIYYQNEFRFRHRDGGYRWFQSQGTIFRDSKGQAVRVLGVHIDITAIKEIESELRASRAALQRTYDDMERLVHVRTAELEKSNQALKVEVTERQMALGALREAVIQLEVAKREAEDANTAKSEFLSRMSHELRTPLNAILGFGQLLGLAELEARDRESVDYILGAGRHLLQLIDEVLDISRIEAGRMQVNLEPVDIAPMVHEALEMTRPLAASRQIQLIDQVGTAGNRPSVRADRQLLRQVLLNLISNAVKYNRDGGEVVISLEEGRHRGVRRICVSDTGMGLSGEELAKLFTPFERLQAARLGVEGTGIGLTLSKRLAEAMGGRIGVESEVGRGSRFWLELAVALEEPPAHSGGVNDGGPMGEIPPAADPGLVESYLESQDFVPRDRPSPAPVPAVETPPAQAPPAIHPGPAPERAEYHGSAGESSSGGALIAETRRRDQASYGDFSNLNGLVLYIEDNLSNLRLVEMIFMRVPGLDLVTAQSGAQGLALASAKKPDVILLDLHLPDMDGEQVLAQLKAQVETRDIPVVVLSADALPKQTARLTAQGIDAYLTKPIDRCELLATVSFGSS